MIQFVLRFGCVCVFTGTWSPTLPTSSSSSLQTWSSAWCSLTTTQVSHEPACRIRLIPLTHPARRAPQFTPSLPPTGPTAAARPAKAATNTSKSLHFSIHCVSVLCVYVDLLVDCCCEHLPYKNKKKIRFVFFLPKSARVVCAFALWGCACDVCSELTLDPLAHCFISATLDFRTIAALACVWLFHYTDAVKCQGNVKVFAVTHFV